MAALLVAILSLGGMLGATVVPAAALDGPYDATDGTLDTAAGIEFRQDLTGSQLDDSYGPGAQEDDLCPPVETGSIPPNKDDLSGYWVGLTGETLYLAWSRTNTNGTATIEYELNQSDVDCGNGVNKVRVPGDLLVTFDFQGGSLSTVPIEVRFWGAGGWSKPVLLDAAQAEASISADFTFGELAIDLTAAKIFRPGECVSFTSAFAKSRASSEGFKSKLKDFVLPIDKNVSNCAEITVVKEADPEGATPFPFTLTGPSGIVVPFTLTDDGTTAGVPDATPNRWSLPNLSDVNGAYVITETLPQASPGVWKLATISCAGGSAVYDLANSRVTVVPGGAVPVTCTFNNNFDAPPTVAVVKTARTTTIKEPGAMVTYDVVVTNTSNEPVAITHLTDTVDSVVTNVFGIKGTTCAVNALLAAGDGVPGGTDTYTCTFSRQVDGNAGSTHVNRVDVTVADDEGETATADDDATVTIVNVLPIIAVTKTANITSIEEPGGNVTYTVVVTNLSNEAVTLTSLTDTVASAVTDVSGIKGTTCALNTVLAAADGAPGGGDTYACTFTVRVAGNAGDVHRNTVTAVAVDDDGSEATASDVEDVSLVDVPPTLRVVKTARTTTIPEPGGPVTFDVSVQNLSNEPVTLTGLTDMVGTIVHDVFAVTGTCSAGTVLAAGDGALGGSDTYTCSFTMKVSGNARYVHDNTVTATVVDDDGSTASNFDTERVTISDVAPEVAITKTALSATVNEPGGPVTYDLVITNKSGEPVRITDLIDVVGTTTSDVFAISGTNCADNRLLAAADGQPGGADTYTCSFTIDVSGEPGDVHRNTVQVTVVDDDGSAAQASDDERVMVVDVAPDLAVTKTANPTTLPEPGGVVTYTVEVVNLSHEAVTVTKLTDTVGDVVTDVLEISGTSCVDEVPLAAGDGVPGGPDTYSCTFTLAVTGNAGMVHTNVVHATAIDDDGTSVTREDDAVVTLTDVLPGIQVVKTATPTVLLAGGTVTYTYVVTNTGIEPLLDVSISDDKCSPLTFVAGDGDGDGQLDTFETWTYRCTSTITVDTTNIVVVTGSDDDGTTVSATDTASVDVISPAIQLDKTADVSSAAPGQTVTYAYAVTNPGDDPLSDVGVTDDKCSPVTFVDGDIDGDRMLDPGETWRFTCSIVVGSDAGPITNTAVASGTPRVGPRLQATDTATITVVPVAVLGEMIERAPAVLAAVIEQPPATLPVTGSGTGLQVKAALVLVLLGGLALVPEHLRRRHLAVVLSIQSEGPGRS